MTTAALNTSQDEKGFGVIQAEWYLNQNLPVNADFANAEFNYQEFYRCLPRTPSWTRHLGA